MQPFPNNRKNFNVAYDPESNTASVLIFSCTLLALVGAWFYFYKIYRPSLKK